jgi:ubiquinone/menaquinone biosynthesis C-methylase UbiE
LTRVRLPFAKAGPAAMRDDSDEVNRTPNICAGPFGGLYDFYIEREWLMRLVGRAIWGIDASVLYASMDPIGRVQSGGTIIDAPCGGGVAFRALREVRYLAGDISEKMLERARARAKRQSLHQVEVVHADMTALPYADGEADLFLSYSGLHMVHDPQRAIEEIGRCLKPGGEVIGTTFLAEGHGRGQRMFKLGSLRGHPLPPRREQVISWLRGLLGCYSNPEIQGRLRQLSEKLERLAASNTVPSPTARVDRRLRCGLVPKAITQVLSESVEPMRVRDIHTEVEALLSQAVSPSAVKNWMARHAQGDHALFVRMGRGRYQLA